MKKLTISAFLISLFTTTLLANEVNIFNARHYKADSALYDKFTKATGIKVNLINGKAGALEKRMIEEGADSSADLYITADAGRCGAFEAKGMLQGGLSSETIRASVPKNFRTNKWVGVAKRARIIYYSPERVSGAELSGLTYEGLADPKWKGRLVIRKSSNIIKVLPKVEGPITEAHFVYPQSLKNTARVQAFRNFLFSKIGDWN